MADYVAREWSNGDIITAANLNDIEQGVAGIDIDLGYSCTEGWVTLTDESVTTTIEAEGDSYAAGNPTYSTPIDEETVKVTFDGTEYTCTGREAFGSMEYGATWDDATTSYDWSTYPFNICPSKAGIRLFTETPGTYQVKIETFKETIETSECFRKAVEQSTQPLFVPFQLRGSDGRLLIPFIDIYSAFRQGRRVIVYISNRAFEITSVHRDSSGGGEVVGDGRTYTASSDDAYPLYSQGSGGGAAQ